MMYAEILSFLTHERGVCMIYSDEKDYVMRMIKEMARVIFSLAFDKTYVSVEMEKANKYRVSGKALNDLWEMIDAGQINEAENLLLEKIDYADKEEVMGAALFYLYLSEKEDSFLEAHQYSKEEVLFGFKQLFERSGYQEILSLIESGI